MNAGKQSQACWLWATLAAALAFTGQYLTVHYNYQGNWTGLFCHGSQFPLPPALRAENVYVFQNSAGYDGQFYHFIAHDPLLKGDTTRYIDAPRLRCRRILVSWLAWLAGGGRAAHAGYIAVMLGFVWLGAWWLARAAVRQGAHAAWALAFLSIPAVLISLDRMTVDGPLAALAAGFAYYVTSGPPWKLYLVLAAAPLVRETGVLLTAAGVLCEFWHRRWRRAALMASSALPALGWFAFVHFRVPGKEEMLLTAPLAGLIERLSHGARYELHAPLATLAAALDWLSLAGMLAGVILAVRLLRKRRDGLALAVVVQILLLSALKAHIWLDAYSYTRIASPLLVLLLAGGGDVRWGWRWLPAGLMLPRIGLQLGRQLLGVLQGVFG